ncbi:MAG: universal stress protein [Phycisphaerales bacterium]|nr:universal stress protein [Phycisphaerales bacterium]
MAGIRADRKDGWAMRILVAVDGSSQADAMLSGLRRAGLPGDCEATVLSVADVWLPGAGSEAVAQASGQDQAASFPRVRQLAEQALADAREFAARACARLRSDFPGWRVSAETAADSPAWSIITTAERLGAELVAVGSHGRSALGRVLLGSVSLRVLDELRCTVRIGREPRQRPEIRVIVAVDGSPDSDAAVKAVCGRRWPKGTSVRVVTAANWRLHNAPLTAMIGPHLSPEAWGEGIAKRARSSFRSAGWKRRWLCAAGTPSTSWSPRPGRGRRIRYSLEHGG